MKTTENSARTIQYESDSFENLLSEIENTATKDSFYLILLVGESEEKRKEVFDKIKEETDKEIKQADANPLISANEAETRQRLDELFKNYNAENTILHVINGANLCGAFTGYTLSKVKYATPQERYFLKKVRQNKAFTIIDFDSIDAVDVTMRRASHSIITFKSPDSGIKGFLAKLKQIQVNGYNLNSKRPPKEQSTSANF